MKKIFAVLLALAMIFSFAACGEKKEAETKEPETQTQEQQQEETKTPEVEIMSHDDYVAAAIDAAVTVDTYVQAKQSWWDGKGTFYTQSEDGAYFLYNMPCTEEEYDKLVPGTRIIVSGYKAEWSGEIEIIDAAYQIMDGSYIAEATDVTDLLGKEELIDHQNEFVSFKGMTVEPSILKAEGKEDQEVAFLYNWDGSGSDGNDLYFNVSKDGQTYNFTVESYLCGPETDVYKAVKELKIGDVIDLEGFLYWYEGANPHITSVKAAQ